MIRPFSVPLESVDGHRLSCYRYDAGALRERAGRGAAVILAHGILAHQKIPTLVRLARFLAGRFTVYTLDFRGHGESGGWFTLGRREHLDLDRLVRKIREGHDRVGIVGFSFGGFHAALTAAETRVDALCLVSAPVHLAILDHFPFGRAWLRTLPLIILRRRGLPRINPLRFPKTRPMDLLPAIAAPALIIHGDSDWLVSLRHAETYHRLIGGKSDLRIVPGGLHAEYLLATDPEMMQDLIGAFLDETLCSHPGVNASCGCAVE